VRGAASPCVTSLKHRAEEPTVVPRVLAFLADEGKDRTVESPVGASVPQVREGGKVMRVGQAPDFNGSVPALHRGGRPPNEGSKHRRVYPEERLTGDFRAHLDHLFVKLGRVAVPPGIEPALLARPSRKAWQRALAVGGIAKRGRFESHQIQD